LPAEPLVEGSDATVRREQEIEKPGDRFGGVEVRLDDAACSRVPEGSEEEIEVAVEECRGVAVAGHRLVPSELSDPPASLSIGGSTCAKVYAFARSGAPGRACLRNPSSETIRYSIASPCCEGNLRAYSSTRVASARIT